jgi:hypothetical protein
MPILILLLDITASASDASSFPFSPSSHLTWFLLAHFLLPFLIFHYLLPMLLSFYPLDILPASFCHIPKPFLQALLRSVFSHLSLFNSISTPSLSVCLLSLLFGRTGNSSQGLRGK